MENWPKGLREGEGIGRAVWLNVATPRNIVDKIVMLDLWSPMYIMCIVQMLPFVFICDLCPLGVLFAFELQHFLSL